MNTYEITYKRVGTVLDLPTTVKAKHYRVVGRFFNFYDDEQEVVATISTDLVALIAVKE